jgi:phosphoserine phosphatase RsbU/P
MKPVVPRSRTLLHWTTYGLALALVAGVVALYVANLVRWPNSPDFGWRTMYNSGPNVVAQVFGAGAEAGLHAGDQIIAINGRRYSTFDELFFGDLRRNEPDSINTYTVLRNGRRVDIAVPTGRVGIEAVWWRSGPLLVLGVIYILIGALVFLMKPRARESWLFLAMSCFLGIGIGLSSPADLIHPKQLYDVRFLANLLIPAAMIHLALIFPKPRRIAENRRWLVALPYVVSFLIFGIRQATSTAHWSMPRPVFLSWLGYALVGILFFVGSNAWNALRDASVVTRLQSRVILVGAVLGFLIPTVNLLSGMLWKLHLFADPILGFGVCFSFFPLSIAYTIVKHDLFAIDVIVRRTYGYVLSTGTVVAGYAGVVSLLNVTFRGSDVARSPLFSIGFALSVVFLFQPLHRKLQRLVDRTFYRQQYDYRATIKSLSEVMTSILEPDVIRRTLVGAVVKEMFLENGALLARRSGDTTYEASALEGLHPGQAVPKTLADDDPVVRVVRDSKAHLLRHDVELNPAFEPDRAALLKTLDDLSSDLVLPMIYKDELRGLMSLGRKKSGKLFTPEDLDLLKTVLNQSAIALENAVLFNENLQKGRMEEELKIAHDIQMGMLPEKPPEVKGLQLAARTISAREVGGDFYDFMEFSGNGSGTQLGLIIADVSGKGVSAGLLMAGARSTYRVLLDSRPTVQDAMILANQRLKQDIRKGMFIALLYAMFEKDGRLLTLANAGQTQPVLVQPGSEPAFITNEGDTFPLGIVADCDYRASTLALTDGSVVVFYTDGVVEAMNAAGELYGFDRLLESVREGQGLGASSLLDKLFADVTGFVAGAEQHDDITIIVARVA